MEQISPLVQDRGSRNAEGKPIAGGQLFRKYLLNRCQDDFERGWMEKEETAVAATRVVEHQAAAKAANDLIKDEDKAKQWQGLIKFLGELFKLQMLTQGIMHECVKKLLTNVEASEEVEIVGLCTLLTSIGDILDTPKARAHMDVYFSRMKQLVENQSVSPRMQFMLQVRIPLSSRPSSVTTSKGRH